MNKAVAIIILNYNKKDYVLQCIESVKKSSFQNYDLYVVDNASTDGSVEAINDFFGREVNLIRNSENKGGSGGFNTGIREAFKKDYKYIYLLDNDVILDEDALKELYNYLERNEDVAIAGSLIYSMDKPGEIQELGSSIDWNNFYINPNYKGFKDNGQLPEIVECDYVAACSLLVRADAIKKAGIIDEGNFIYWDDIEWAYRMKLAGFRVVSYTRSNVWHKMGVKAKSNTFGTYYFWRNRVHFFVKYLDKDRIKEFAEKIFDEIFQAVYSCNYTGKYSSAKTIIAAVEDACHNVRGKAPAGRIFDIELIENKLQNIITDKKNILLIDYNDTKILRDVTNELIKLNNDLNITIAVKYSDINELREQFGEYKVIKFKEAKYDEYDLVGQVCFHIFDIKNKIEDRMDFYIDRFFNVVSSNEDREYVKGFDNVYKMMKNIYYPLFLNKLLTLKGRLDS
ncbi:MAG: hypothetical protein PWR10_643 [Halanaerobiales bacterium]|nr:hypothetical protein [Halanaerobiales bacterium]